MIKIEIQDKENKVFFGIKNGLVGQEIYISPFDSKENYIEIDRFQTYIASEGMVFDYIDLEEDMEHLYKSFLIIDRLYDSIDNYIQVNISESEE